MEPENQSGASYLTNYPVDYPLYHCDTRVRMAFGRIEFLSVEGVVDGAQCRILAKEMKPL